MRIPSLSFLAGILAVAAVVVCRAATAIPPVSLLSATRVATVQVRVSLDRNDWTYRAGEPAKFKVVVTADNQPLDNVPITYVLGPELMPAPTKAAVVPADGLIIDAGTMKEPGFVRCSVSTEVAGKTYRGAATAAFSPEKIVAFQTEPADFEAFWRRGKDELAKIPMEARVTLLPDQCTSAMNVYHVNFRTVGESWTAPARIYGILCEPKAPGKYPAILRVPGAGVRPYGGDKDLATRGAITLEIGIHGIPVNQPQENYDQLFAGALRGYWVFNLDDKEQFYYRRVYLSCVRANDFLTSRENWDGKNLLVAGASQGGQLAIVTTALDPRVTAVQATHPAFCDVAAPLHGRAGGWPHPFMPDPTTGAPSHHATPAKIATATYYDTVNFARRIRVPGYYIWGYNDDVCPPTSTFAAYNAITAPKELALELEQAHTYPAEQYEAVTAWIMKTLPVGTRPAPAAR